jgi:hypothetical protein
MGVVSFLIVELYQDLKTLMVSVNDMKIMVAEQKKDIEYLKDNYQNFREDSRATKVTLTKLEETK